MEKITIKWKELYIQEEQAKERNCSRRAHKTAIFFHKNMIQ